MIDLVGLSLNKTEQQQLSMPSVCGVILFGRNYKDKPQLTKLIGEIRAINPSLLISVDHEGGRVQRFREGFTRLPAMATLGSLYKIDKQNSLNAAFACGFVLAYELLEVGIDFSFTPVLDIDYEHNKVIGDRAFSTKPEIIIALSQALIRGMKQAGMISVAKHFPGHGFVDLDSHVNLPIDSRSLEDMADDLSIFKTILPLCEAVMPAHIIYDKLDAVPAGFSNFWLQDKLIKEYGYKGIIISDDLSMQGAVEFMPNIKTRIKTALNAGCDIVLVCNQSEVLPQILEGNYKKTKPLTGLRGNFNNANIKDYQIGLILMDALLI